MPTTATGPYERLGGSRPDRSDPRSPVAVDRDRVIHSHAFRRLQRKTQIVGLSSDDFLRSRLTHTIECAQIGRAIAARIDLDEPRLVEGPGDLVDLVEAACLIHDLGHPPFGHTGEQALDAVLSERAGIRFEANAQSFRIVTLLEPKKYNRETLPVHRPLGLDLTRATLQAVCKYPWTDGDPRAEAPGRKFGIYEAQDDLEYFAWLWDGNHASASRTPATDILEAADDIAYAVHDLEDGIWCRLVPIDQIAQGDSWPVERIAQRAIEQAPDLFRSADDVAAVLEDLVAPLRDARWARGPFDRSRSAEGGLKSFCSALTGEFIDEVTADRQLRWNDNTSLLRRIAALKAVVWVWMIDQPDLVSQRFGHQRIVGTLFDAFMDEPAMLPYASEWERVRERSGREQARLIADHIASMTDEQAHRTYLQLVGITSRSPLR